jgi:myo-inositol-1(or 4)-monophosphatase
MDELDFLLKIAKSAAMKAGRLLYQNIGVKQTILLNEGRDIKLQIDADAEGIIKDYLGKKSKFAILGEETGLSQDLGEFYWVVDPLDGTSNFLRGIPISCVSIALMQNLHPILGVIYDFNHDDLYYASTESKAYLNEIEMRVSKYSQKNESTLMTGIPAKTNYSDEEFHMMIDDFQAWKKVRMIGSAAMSSIYVASGQAETYKENGIYLWDIAAGAAIVNSAGGEAIIENLQSDFTVNAKFTNKIIES